MKPIDLSKLNTPLIRGLLQSLLLAQKQRILNMALLSNTKDDFVKELHVEIPLEDCTPELRSALAKEFKRHKGAARLFLDVTFRHDGIDDRLSHFSKKFSLSPSYELYDFLDKKNLRHHAVTKVTL